MKSLSFSLLFCFFSLVLSDVLEAVEKKERTKFSTFHELLSSLLLGDPEVSKKTVKQKTLDNGECSDRKDCGSCRGTVSPEGLACHWFYSYSYRYCDDRPITEGLGFFDAVGDDAASCADVSCEGCLSAGGSWTMQGSCIPDCNGYNEEEGSTCFSSSGGDSAVSELCAIPENANTDWQSCRSMDGTDCETCTGTLQMDGTPCNWYEGEGYCEPSSVETRYGMDNPEPRDCSRL